MQQPAERPEPAAGQPIADQYAGPAVKLAPGSS
jgi:hypothetical protein